jgi:hypothetical protein
MEVYEMRLHIGNGRTTRNLSSLQGKVRIRQCYLLHTRLWQDRKRSAIRILTLALLKFQNDSDLRCEIWDRGLVRNQAITHHISHITHLKQVPVDMHLCV